MLGVKFRGLGADVDHELFKLWFDCERLRVSGRIIVENDSFISNWFDPEFQVRAKPLQFSKYIPLLYPACNEHESQTSLPIASSAGLKDLPL